MANSRQLATIVIKQRWQLLACSCRNYCKSAQKNVKWWAQSFPRLGLDAIEKNVVLRKHRNNLPEIRRLLKELESNGAEEELERRLNEEIIKLPNTTHPRVVSYCEEPHEIFRSIKRQGLENNKEFSALTKYLNFYRMDHLGNYTGHKSYYLMGPLATMEQALTNYAVDKLLKNGFKLMSVPDILPASIIEGCGMATSGDRTQVYKLDSGRCLSGTSEMALAGYFSNEVFCEEQLPLKVAAVSRCFRAETSGLQEEKGIYRVHQFTKVEMFAVCSDADSENMLHNFRDMELNLFNDLNFNYRVLDMPASELGAPAYQKYDIEAWMPGRSMWGEISSCSNCTDYQAHRLNIRYHCKDTGITKFVHTVNGTAVAVPRLLIAIIENNQDETGNILVPEPLQKYMNGNVIGKVKGIPDLKFYKSAKS